MPASEALARLCEEGSTVRVIVSTTRSEVSTCGGSIVTGPSEVIGNSARWLGTVEPPLIPGRSRNSLVPVASGWSGRQAGPVAPTVGVTAGAARGAGGGVVLVGVVFVFLDAGLGLPVAAGGRVGPVLAPPSAVWVGWAAGRVVRTGAVGPPDWAGADAVAVRLSGTESPAPAAAALAGRMTAQLTAAAHPAAASIRTARTG